MTDDELREAGIHEDCLGAVRGTLFVVACWLLLGVAVLGVRGCS